MGETQKEKFLIIDNRVPSTKSIYRKLSRFWDAIDICDLCEDVVPEDYLGIILSGTDIPVTQSSIYEKEQWLIQNTTVPVLGICGGFQLMALTFGARLSKMGSPLFGCQEIFLSLDNPLFKGMSSSELFLKKHIYQVKDLPDFLEVIASSEQVVEAFQHKERPLFGVQFHPEYRKSGEDVLGNFVAFCLERAEVIIPIAQKMELPVRMGVS